MIDFSPLSKVWIYQAERPLTSSEIAHINNAATAFIADWTSHGKLMKATIISRYNLFLILMVDETQADASGCGIDKSVRFFQQMEKDFSINLMNRLKVAYKAGEEVICTSLAAFEKKIESGEINGDTIVFNNLVQTKSDFESNWEVPLHSSWHAKMLV